MEIVVFVIGIAILFLIFKKERKSPEKASPIIGDQSPESLRDEFETVTRSNASKILDRHFEYQMQIESAYAKRNKSPKYLEQAKLACLNQIKINEQAKNAWFKEYPYDNQLPVHRGYTQLTIILDKEGDYEGAIGIARKAMTQGWDGEWEKRIARYEKKLMKG